MEKKSRNRLIVVTIIILVFVVFLVYRSSVGSYTYFKSVKELKKDTSLVGVSVRVGGEVEKGSLKHDSKGYRFVLTEESEKLKVNYRRVLPQTFKEGIFVIVEGKYKDNQEVDAEKIITKCPTKYQGKAEDEK